MQMTIEWSNFPVILEYHPGPTSGSCWIVLPEPKIIFVGDLVIKNQTPFLSSANLPEWLGSLDHLMSEYKDFIIVSGRSGVVNMQAVQEQHNQISALHEKLEALAQKQAGPDAVEGLIQPVMGIIKAPAEKQKQYVQRLAYGLRHYFARHYRPAGSSEIEEE
jgi:glyoxylase-like metal-dependent hydrolase (beta-lactamase superfamily II)